ncbi:MAG: hypothetical protein ABSF14_20425 [Terriglobia bacterium]|jgi:hypothetical protein
MSDLDQYGGMLPDFFDASLETEFLPDEPARAYTAPDFELGDRCLTIPLETVLPSETLVGDFSVGTILPDDLEEP